MKRIVMSLMLATMFSMPVAQAYDGDGGNGSGDGCYHGDCGNRHRHDGDNVHFPDFNQSPVGPIYICVQPGSCSDNGGKK